MPRLFLLVIGWVLSSAVKKLLVGAGLATVSYSVLTLIFDRYSNALFSSYYGQNWFVGILQYTELDTALSIVLSAVIARAALNAMTVAITR